ncbi:MAG: toll/interleukin-1 receptor domain-containing protein [Chlorobaculum sp.]|nr:toll/interleukin-1 receptor domain-containing protein [Chlorobaculum sp.]
MGKNILTRELLLKSVWEWNKARRANPDIIPDLSGVDFREASLDRVNLADAKLDSADFSEAHCYGADFIGANLSHAVFSKAYLKWSNFTDATLVNADMRAANCNNANLIGANLNRANFQNAALRNANLSYAQLQEANLSGANLVFSNLQGAYLNGTNVNNVLIGLTIFADVDLSSAIGLETIRHEGPSTIGIDTIYKSNGNIPEVFLRGCGVPENFIEYVRTLTPMTKDYSSCFISYSAKDDDFARRIHNDLQASGVRCWFAPHDLPIGAKTRPAIDDAIRIHDKLLLILSEHSVQSNWVEHEVEHALDLETVRGKLVLFPVRLDDAVMDSKTGWASNVKRQRNIGDFTRWKDHDSYQKAFSRLLRDLKQ